MKAVIKRLMLLVTIAILIPWNFVFASTCDSAWLWYQEGLALYDNSNREADYYRKAIDMCPEFVEAYNGLGRVYLNQGKYDLSLQFFNQARIQALSSDLFSSRPGSRDQFIESIIGLGEVYRIQGQYSLAAAEFKRALEIVPDSSSAQNHLQYIYKRQHKYDSVLSPHHKMLTNGIFARIPGTVLARGWMAFSLLYRNWEQTSRITTDMFDDERVALIAGPSKREAHIQVYALGMRYGLSNNLTIGLTALYFVRDVDFRLGYKDIWNVNAKPSVNGLGDMMLLTKYHLWGNKKNHLSIYNLLTIPTGEQKTAVADQYIWTFGKFEKVKRKIPLGSGSYDFTPGIALTTYYDPVIFQSNMQYRITDGKRVGDEFAANFAVIYPLNNAVNVTMETGYRWHDDTERKQTTYISLQRPDYVGNPPSIPAGPEKIDTSFTSKGGHSLFIAPGFQFTLARGLKLELGMKIPVVKQDEGWREDFVFHAGLVKMIF